MNTSGLLYLAMQELAVALSYFVGALYIHEV